MNPKKTTLAALSFAEHDILHQAQSLRDLAELLAECGTLVPACYFACRRVRKLRRHLLRVLPELDGPLTDAIRNLKENDQC